MIFVIAILLGFNLYMADMVNKMYEDVKTIAGKVIASSDTPVKSNVAIAPTATAEVKPVSSSTAQAESKPAANATSTGATTTPASAEAPKIA